MASSTSSSDAGVAAPLLDGERERAFEREVPKQAWPTATLVALVLTLVGATLWELKMRALGLRAGDLDDGPPAWADERRKIDAGPRDQVALIGDSRILFDTDLDIFQEIVGRRPIQLALPGTPGVRFLTDLADDERFAGLVVVGMVEPLYFSGREGLMGGALEYARTESPSQRASFELRRALSRGLAFMDDAYTPFTFVEQLELPNRRGVKGPYDDVWKLSEAWDDRQTRMWSRLETDPYLRAHAIMVWGDGKGKPLSEEQIQTTIAAARRDCAKLRARGGEVVFLRPPSAPPNRANEETRAPRAKVWDALLRETGSFGVHFEDHPAMQGLTLPERSHLSAADAKVFTRAYAAELVKGVPWLTQHPAPARQR